MKTRLLLLACALPAIAPAFADSTLPSPRDTTSSSRLIIKRTGPEEAAILEKSRPSEAQDIPIPKFVVKSPDNKFLLTIGGVINPILGYDIGNNLYRQDDAGPSFVTSAIPVPAVAGKKGDFFINPLNGNVDLQVVGLGGTANEITGYVKIGTNGINNALKLKKAFVTYRHFTAGLVSTLFKDGDACQPPTIDPQGPCGEVSTSNYEISYTSPSYGGFRYAVGLDVPSFNSSNGYYQGKDFPEFVNVQVDNYADAENLVPDIPAWVEYTFSDNNRIRVSGLLRTFAYRDLLAGKTRHSVGWGAMLSGNLSPDPRLVFYYQAAYGKGIGAYIQDIAGHPVSFVPKDSRPGHMTPSPMLGAVVGVSYNPTSKLQFNAMFSESRIWGVSAYSNILDESENYKYALYAAANCFYTINNWLQWGVEYVWGRRVTWNIEGANDSRIQTQIAFTF